MWLSWVLPLLILTPDGALAVESSFAAAGCRRLAQVHVSAKGAAGPGTCCGTVDLPCSTLSIAASTLLPAGGTILLHSGGVYAPPPNLGGRNVSITAYSGTPVGATTRPTIDCAAGRCMAARCAAASAAVPCAQAELSLAGVAVRNGAGATNGGCLDVDSQSLTLNDVALTGCTADVAGGAVAVTRGPRVAMVGVSIRLSQVLSTGGGGGGIALLSVGSASLAGLDVALCWANSSRGGGLYMSLSAADISATTVTACSARLAGGCIASINSLGWSIRDSQLSLGQAASGGCLADEAAMSVSVWNVSMVECAAEVLSLAYLSTDMTYGGGAFFNYSLNATVSRSLVDFCTADLQGGGISAQNHLALGIYGTTISNSVAVLGGAGVDIGSGPMDMQSSSVVSNTLHPSGDTAFGAGVYVTDAAVSIAGCNISSNDGTWQYLSQAQAQGSGLCLASVAGTPSAVVSDTVFANNIGVRGGALFSAYPVSVSRSNFSGNSASFAGAVYLTDPGANATFLACRFEGNSGYQNGGAVQIQAASPILFEDSVFSQNTAYAGDGGAVIIQTDQVTDVKFRRCHFEANVSPAGTSGAIFMGGTVLTVISSSFTANSASGKGGAVTVLGTVAGASSSPLITEADFSSCAFLSNSAGLDGGALFVASGGVASLTSCRLEGNMASCGAAMAVQDASSLNLRGSSCQGNRAALCGGCISAADSSNVTVAGTWLTGNRGGSQGGAIRLSGLAELQLSGGRSTANSALGGGMLWSEMDAHATLGGTLVANNSAQFFGGAIYMLHSAVTHLSGSHVSSNSAALGGAVLAESRAALTSHGTVFAGNAQHALAVRGHATIALLDGAIANNSASAPGTTTGGGLWASESASAALASVELSGNAAVHGAGVYSESTAAVSASNCSFSDNVASASGGGGYAEGNSTLTVSGSEFIGNDATEAGAGVAFAGSAAGAVTDSRFLGNSAGQEGSGVFLQRGPSGLEAQAMTAAEAASVPSHISRAAALRGVIHRVTVAARVSGYRPVNCSHLFFNGTRAPPGQGAAFFDASFLPPLRTNCTACVGASPADSIGSMPVDFAVQWATAASTGSFIVFADAANPVVGLSVTLYDARGQIASQGYSAVADVQPDPRISGMLRGTVVNGTAIIPPISIPSLADTAANFTLSLTVSSPSASFPPISKKLQVSFCAAGYYLNSTTNSCLLCPIGSWCAPGQVAQLCSPGSYTFFPGQSVASACVSCPGDTAIDGSTVLDCGATTPGSAVVLPGWWLDPTSLNTSAPAVHPCDVSAGCMGMAYVDPTTPQCADGYQQVRLCSLCAPDHYMLTATCYRCDHSFTKLYPLYVVLLVLFWIAVAMLSAAYHTASILVLELQVITLLGTLNLSYLPWVRTIVQICGLFLFDPAIIGVECHVDFTLEIRWLVTLVIGLTGVAGHALAYVLLRAVRQLNPRRREETEAVQAVLERSSGVPNVDLMSRLAIPLEAKAMRGLVNWLDLMYLPLALRCLQAFYWRSFDVRALGFAPTVLWWSSTSQLLFALSVVFCVLYLALWPLAFVGVLVYAKTHKLMKGERLRESLGGQLTRYEASYFWWHAVVFTRRVVYACIYILLHSNPALQMGLLIPIQVINLGLQFAASPFTSGSHDLVSSSLLLGAILFSISVTGQNFLFQKEDTISDIGLYASVVMVCAPFLAGFLYEMANKYLLRCNLAVLRRMWVQCRKDAGDAGAEEAGAGGGTHPGSFPRVLDPGVVAEWFRPHIIAQVLVPSRPAERELLLQVAASYERVAIGAPKSPDGARPASDDAVSVVVGDVRWTKGLKKSQLFAALHQVVLGATVGEKVVAEVPLRAEDRAAWAAMIVNAGGGSIDLTPSRGLARFRSRKASGNSRHLASRHGSLQGSSALHSQPQAQAASASLSGPEHGHDPAAAAGEPGSSTPSPLLPPLRPMPRSTSLPGGPQADASAALPPVSEHADDARGAAAQKTQRLSSRLLRMLSGHSRGGDSSGGATPVAGTDFFPGVSHKRSLTEDDAGSVASWGGPRGGAALQDGRSMARLANSTVKLVDEKPLDLWPPPLENRATWAVRDLNQANGSEGPQHEDGSCDHAARLAGGGRVLEALMDSTGLSLAFQESFGQLTLVEKKMRPHALRRLLASAHVPQILAWLSSNSCSLEDQRLFVELLQHVKKAVEEEAGKVEWWPCVLRVASIAGIFCRPQEQWHT